MPDVVFFDMDGLGDAARFVISFLTDSVFVRGDAGGLCFFGSRSFTESGDFSTLGEGDTDGTGEFLAATDATTTA